MEMIRGIWLQNSPVSTPVHVSEILKERKEKKREERKKERKEKKRKEKKEEEGGGTFIFYI